MPKKVQSGQVKEEEKEKKPKKVKSDSKERKSRAEVKEKKPRSKSRSRSVGSGDQENEPETELTEAPPQLKVKDKKSKSKSKKDKRRKSELDLHNDYKSKSDLNGSQSTSKLELTEAKPKGEVKKTKSKSKSKDKLGKKGKKEKDEKRESKEKRGFKDSQKSRGSKEAEELSEFLGQRRSTRKSKLGFSVEMGPYPLAPTEEELKDFTLSLEAKQAHTAIVLLDSEETNVLVDSLMGLAQFCNRQEENKELFVALGGVDRIWKFFHHEHVIIQRMALKIMAIVSSVHQVKLICRDYMMAEELMGLLMSEDKVVIEYAAVISKNLSSLFAGRLQLIRYGGIPLMLPLTQHADPDISKNAIEFIFNLLEEPLHHSLLLTPENIDFFFKLIDSDFQAIGLTALNVLEKLSRSLPGVKLLEKTEIIEHLSRNLDDASLGDLDRVSLQILVNLTQNVTNCQKMTGLYPQLTSLLDESKDLQVLVRLVKLLGRMARIPAITSSLVNNYDFVPKLILIMNKYSDAELRAAATYTAAQVGATDYNAKRLLAEVFPALKSFFFDIRANSEALEYILLTSSVVLEGGDDMGRSFINAGGLSMLHRVLGDVRSGKYTNHTIISALSCINTLGHTDVFREAMVREGLVPVVLEQMTTQSTHVVALAANALCSLLCVPEGRKEFLEKEGYKYVVAATKCPELNVVVSISPLINAIGSYPDVAKELINKGMLTTLWKRQDLIAHNAPLRVSLNRLITNHLPAKFAYTGHIGPYERLPHGFYDVGHLKPTQAFTPFETIQFHERAQHERIIYLNLDPTFDPALFEHNPIMRRMSESEEEMPCIRTYAAQIRNLMSENIRSEKDLVGLIAVCICAKMGGTLDKWRVSAEAEQAELADFQSKYQSVGMPLTLMTNGAHRPRALLFKALADLFGIPCSLDRGGFKKCWNVVLIRAKEKHTYCPCPVTPEEEEQVFFTERLRGFVVDLLYSPGSLFPLYSYEADTYCFC